MLLVIVIRLVRACGRNNGMRSGRIRIIEVGSEREEFYMPGDPAPSHAADNNDYEDADDL